MRDIGKKLDLNLTLPLAVILIVLIGFGLFWPNEFSAFADGLLYGMLGDAEWFFMTPVLFFVIVALIVALSPFGNRIVGGIEQKPQLGNFSYLAVIITGSMGSALLFWSTAEPLIFFSSPPSLMGYEAGTPQAAAFAIAASNNHWSFIYWFVQAIWCVALAYFCIDKGLPMRPSSTLWPLLKEKIYKWPGKLVDLVCLFAITGGMICSLGFGSTQIASGLQYVLGITPGNLVYAIIMAVITFGFVFSSWRGVKKGIKFFADINGYIFIFLFVLLVIVGPTIFLLNLYMDGLGHQLYDLIPYVSNSDPFGVDGGWSSGYTGTYYVWAFIFCPIAALFFATVSRGRTYRQMILLSTIPPTLFCLFIFCSFGGNAIYLESVMGVDLLAEITAAGNPAASYIMIEHVFANAGLPGGFTTIIHFLLVIALFISFVTMADNLTYSIAQLTSRRLDKEYGGFLGIRVFWGTLIGVMAMVCLLVVGQIGMNGLQSMAVAMGLPFYIVMFLLLYCVLKLTRDGGNDMDKKFEQWANTYEGKVNEQAD